MELLIRVHGHPDFSLRANGSVDHLKRRLAERTGISAEDQALSVAGRPLRDSDILESCGVQDGTVLTLSGRLMGGATGALTLTLKPRVQKDKWSLYWKESMETKTEVLEDVTLQLDPTTKVSDMLTALQQKVGWPNPEASERLAGFKDPWEFAVHQGRTLDPSKSLAASGLPEGTTVVCVRRVLVPEEWKILEEGQDEDDLRSDEEW